MKEQIREFLANGQFEEADVYMNEHVTADSYDEDIAIFDGTIGLCYGDDNRVWQACANGLALNPRNYELYVILGEYYLSKNLNQAYLCYENALFFCNNEEDKALINEALEKLLETGEVTVRKASFIILSYNLLDYTSMCIDSIRLTVPESAREIVVVDNASEDGSVAWLREQKDIVLVENSENAGFPKGCNIGIEAANRENDIFLLNNDTLMVDNSLFWLRMGLYESEEVGTTGSVSNYVGNMQKVAGNISDVNELMKYGILNNVPTEHPYEEKLFLIGFALLIKRNVLNIVGNLDERFTPGNFEDNDYGMRVLRAGYKNVLCKNSFIIHFGSKSFKKEVNKYVDVMRINAQKFQDKWDIDPRSHFYPKQEFVKMIEDDTEREMNILEIGCGCGVLLGFLKGLYPKGNLFGVENKQNLVEFAKCMGDVVFGEYDVVDLPWEEGFFDYLIINDALENIEKPEEVLKCLHKYLKKEGHIILNVLNPKHYSKVLALLYKDEFVYSEMKCSVSNMYTGTEIVRIMNNCGYKVEMIGYNNTGTTTEYIDNAIDKLLEMTGNNNRDAYLAYQYIVKATPDNN